VKCGAIPYSNHGVERETRLELATLTLARWRSNFVFGRGRKRLVNDYLPPTSTPIEYRSLGTRSGSNRAWIPRSDWSHRDDCAKRGSVRETALASATRELATVAQQLAPITGAASAGLPASMFARMDAHSLVPSAAIPQMFQLPAFKRAADHIGRAASLRGVLSTPRRPGPLVGVKASGSMSVLNGEAVATGLVLATLERLTVDGQPLTAPNIEAQLAQFAEELEVGMKGGAVPITRLVGLSGCPLEDGAVIETPWGSLRKASGRLSQITLGERTADAVLVLNLRDKLRIQAQGTAPPMMTPTAEEMDLQTRWHTLLPLAIILGSDQGTLLAPVPVWQRFVSCVSGYSGLSGWIPPTRLSLGQRNDPLRPAECRLIEGWAERLEVRFDDRHLGVAARRILRAVTGRIDIEDRLIDAVTSWEALVGTGTETTFRVTAALAFLLAEPGAARRIIATRLRKTYGLRSRVVHGAVVNPAELDAAARSAVGDAISAFKRLLTERDDLVEMESEARSDRLLFGA
jgi:Apea-like HEPN